MEVAQLHDSESEEILGTVHITQGDMNMLWNAWEQYNKIEGNDNVDDFVAEVNDSPSDLQLESVSVNFIQL